MKNTLFLGFLMTLIFLSCKKENPAQPELLNYTPLSIGNYWVYEGFKIDANGNEEPLNNYDSLVINRDTIINGHSYFVLEGNQISSIWEIKGILRDSAEYVVDSDGKKFFSATDFTNVLDTSESRINGELIFKTSTKMESVQKNITVPAGNFNVINKQTTVFYKSTKPNIPDVRYSNAYYANGVGNILVTYFFAQSNNVFERRLMRYHIE